LSDTHGNFSIIAGRPSKYRILPEKSSAGFQWQRYPFYRNPALPLLDVTLTESNPNATVSVPLGEKNGFLTGKLVDSTTGLAIQSAKFFMCHVADPRICWGTAVKSPDGAFNIAAAHVPFTLKVSADGFEDWWGPNGVGQNNAMSVAPGTQIELPCLLRRTPGAANRPLSETEKDPLKNLAAPVPISPADRIEFTNYPRHTTLEWQPVAGADHYLVEIDYCDGRDRGLRECVNPLPFSTTRYVGPVKVQATSYEFDFLGRQPGRWRVWAVDRNGEEGFKSSWRVFFYLK
jgi:hypothetical protein